MGEYVCPIMKCEGTDTERSVLPIAGCHIYIHVFVCVCVCVSMMGGGDWQRGSLSGGGTGGWALMWNSRGVYVSK